MKGHQEKLVFFCYPKFDAKMDTLHDFPDPHNYLVGFFVGNPGNVYTV